MKPMKKEWKIVIAVIVILAVVVGAMYLGVIPDALDVQSAVNGPGAMPEETTCNVNLDLSDTELFAVLELFFEKDLNYAQVAPYFDSLHMIGYGCNQMNAQTLLEQFEASYALDGWASAIRTPQYKSNWAGYHEIWTRGTDARSMSVAEGAGVTMMFPEYATVYLVAYGPQTTYYQFYALVK
jgi:hypothetical protein